MLMQPIATLPALDAGTALTRGASSIERSLEAIGWQLLNVEIDTQRETARIELKRGDLHVLFDARNGRASLTREMRDTRQQRIGRKGDITVVDRIEPRFLGRTRCENLREGLQALSHYVADNAAAAIGHDQAQDIFRSLVQGQAALPA